jgi:hypothetical protein
VDPTLRRLLEEGAGDDQVSIMIRLEGRAPALPADARVVARFGDIATVRIARNRVEALRDSSDVRSVKASYRYRPELVSVEAATTEVQDDDRRRPRGLLATGRGVVVGVADWGLDFRHPAFRRADGATRVLALWDQAAPYDPARPNRFGYGIVHERAVIDAALRQSDPVAALGYDPAVWDVVDRRRLGLAGRC